MTRYRRATAAGLATVVVLAAGGCSTAITGTPVATPGEAGKAAAGAALASTTCREYTEMNSSARREVIAAIGADGNDLVATNPDLWAGVAAALCTFASPSAPVRDVVTGGIR
jgi:hypothetical protein